jgi:formylglycine-generating enzyme required for sulfatase activity
MFRRVGMFVSAGLMAWLFLTGRLNGSWRWSGDGAVGAERSVITNGLGMRMVRIEPGRFRMGSDRPVGETLGGPLLQVPETDWDEKPIHDVTLTRPFRMAETEVTIEQFRQFKPDFTDAGHAVPYATGISWEEAVAFCQWLSRRESQPYRLPTEAEWEYAARAGAATHFAGGDEPPSPEWANGWGVRNMHTGALEWCLDWHGEYPEHPEVDPVGVAEGIARVVRGGGIQMENPVSKVVGSLPFYRRAANRAGMIPTWNGNHTIGLRVVLADPPAGRPRPVTRPFIQEGVAGNEPHLLAGPPPDRPWYRQRPLLPIPPENATREAIRAVGLHPAIQSHNHSPGFVVCPNGDLLAIFFSATYYPSTRYDKQRLKEVGDHEYWPDVPFIATRLRYGSETWEMPEVIFDLPDVNDQTSLLWNENGTIWHFAGGAGLPGVPFRLNKSNDSGATWSPIIFPTLRGAIGGYYPQPINSVFRDDEGTIFVPTDGIGGQSLLWASRDNGATWFDTGGRTGGRHTTFALLRDGSILGLGGKSTDIDGFMPASLSRDKGRTWTVTRTPFAALGANQRPTLLRLASGRLFFAGDYQHYNGKSPSSISARGSYVALSSDEGQHWTIRALPGALPHRSQAIPDHQGAKSANTAGTLGYSVARQAPNGVIHLLATMNHPAQHFELNEAWILGTGGTEAAAVRPAKPLPPQIERDQAGRRRVRHGLIAADGRYLRHGTERWYHPDGRLAYQAEWKRGYRVGLERWLSANGQPIWEWEHRGAPAENSTGTRSTWTHFWPNGRMRRQSSWQGHLADGPARSWDQRGLPVDRLILRNGDLQR